MDTIRIDGKALAKNVREEVGLAVAARKEKSLSTPGLATILVGEDPASQVYVSSKQKNAEKLGIYSKGFNLPEDTSQEELLDLITKLNNDPKIHGILVQLPIPKHLDEVRLIEQISPRKDVDGLHPMNAGLLAQKGRTPMLAPATPSGVMLMLERLEIPIEGANAVVLGRSNIVGIPIASLLLNANATVTICHSRTRDLAQICSTADILVAAVGRLHMLGRDHVKEGAIVLDVGINRKDDGKLAGDVDFAAVRDKCSAITPVPGGVGPMTIAMLLSNTVDAYKRRTNVAAENG